MLRTSVPRQARQSTVLPSPPCRLRLRVRLANGNKKTFTVETAKSTIGNHPSCTIRLPTPCEKGIQCFILHSRGKVVVRSWSESATLNGRRFDIANLKAGDKLQVAGCTVRILRSKKKRQNTKTAAPLGAQFGKRLVGEIGKRLAHLEDRLLARQRRLSRQLEKRASQPVEATEAIAVEPYVASAAPSPMVVEGLSTLRSAVEELRARVEDVALRPWPVMEPPQTIDTEALLATATSKMSEVVENGQRSDRTHSALKFEQISRDFDRIGQRLGDVESKLNLPSTELIAEQIRPVSEAVEFVRVGLQSLEDRQSLETTRFEKLSTGLDALRQSTIERLVAMGEKVNSIPSLTKVEQALDAVNQKVESTIERLGAMAGKVDAIPSSAKVELALETVNQKVESTIERLGAMADMVNAIPSSTNVEQALENVNQKVESTIDQLVAMGQKVDAIPALTKVEQSIESVNLRVESTMERLGAIAEKVDAIPSLTKVESALESVSQKVEGLSREISQRQDIAFTRDEAASLIEQVEAATIARGDLQQRLVEFGEHFVGMRSEWAEYQIGTSDQIRALSTKIESLPTPTGVAPGPQIDITPLEQRIAECQSQLADQAQLLSSCASGQEQFVSRLSATEAIIESLKLETGSIPNQHEQIKRLTVDTAAARSIAEEARDQTQAVQSNLLQQLLSLEDRCVFLESELARLSRVPQAVENNVVTNSEATPSYTLQSEGYSLKAEYGVAPELTLSSYNSNESPLADSHSSANASPSDAEAESHVYEREEEEATPELSDPTESPANAELDADSSVESPDAIMERLRRSGIWKDEEKELEMAPEEMDDPRDVVGTTYEADPTPPKGFDSSTHTGKHPVDQLKAPAWGNAHPGPSENEEESIDAYMERLLQRVSGSTGEVTGAMAVAEHLQRAKLEAAKKRESRPEAGDGDFEYTPRGPAPEKSTDLSALRELAMTSANANIQNYNAATKAKTANEKWVVVVVAMTCAMGLLYVCVNYKSDWTYLAAGAAFIVALYWAIQASFTTVAAKRLNKAKSDPNPAADAAAEPKSRRKSDIKPSLLDQPSAGDTFKALIAERERENIGMEESAAASIPNSSKDSQRMLDMLKSGIG